jgi:hypothetical protein
MTTLRALLAAGIVVTTFGVAVAKLPPTPPMTDEQKAAAEEKKAKEAAANELANQQLARAQDRVVAAYLAAQKAMGKSVAAPAGPASAATNALGKSAGKK